MEGRESACHVIYPWNVSSANQIRVWLSTRIVCFPQPIRKQLVFFSVFPGAYSSGAAYLHARRIINYPWRTEYLCGTGIWGQFFDTSATYTSSALKFGAPRVYGYPWHPNFWCATAMSVHPGGPYCNLVVAHGWKGCATGNGLLVAHCFSVRHG